MDIPGAGVEEIVLSSLEDNFHVLNRVEARQSELLLVSLPLHPTSPVVKEEGVRRDGSSNLLLLLGHCTRWRGRMPKPSSK